MCNFCFLLNYAKVFIGIADKTSKSICKPKEAICFSVWKFFRYYHRIPIEKKADDYHVKFLPVTEPDSDYFFFHIETVRNVLDFFRSGFWVLIEGSFKSNTNGGLDGGSFFTPPSKSVCSTQRTAIKSA
jgi:hypothetical protein